MLNIKAVKEKKQPREAQVKAKDHYCYIKQFLTCTSVVGWHYLAASHPPSDPSLSLPPQLEGKKKNMRNLVVETKGGEITQKLLSWAN